MDAIKRMVPRLRCAGTLPLDRALSTLPSPPPRRPSLTTSVPTATASTSGKPDTLPSSSQEDHDDDKPTFTSALRLMDASSASLAAKAFSIATGVVILGGVGVVWTLKLVWGIHDTSELVQHIRDTLSSAPGSALRNPPTSETHEL